MVEVEGRVEVISCFKVEVTLENLILASHQGIDLEYNCLGSAEEVSDLRCGDVVDRIYNYNQYQDKYPLVVVLIVYKTYLARDIGTDVFTPLKHFVTVNPENLLFIIIDILQLIFFYHVTHQRRVVIFQFLQVLVRYEPQKIKTSTCLIKTKFKIVIYYYTQR